MTEIDPYALLVDFYDQWVPATYEDVEFYVRRALEVSGPVVELAAGHGRVAIPVARAGRDVIAVDRSPAMIAEGRRRAALAGVAERITWIEDDMRTFVADPPVELVTIPYRSFLHLVTVADQLAALGAVRRSLAPGGRLALNFFLPDPAYIVENHGRAGSHGTFEDERGRRCQVVSIPEYEVEAQMVRLRARVEVLDAGGDAPAGAAETTLELRLVYRYEMEHLFARAGFEVEHLYGWFDERPFGPGCREMIWVARVNG